MAIADLESTFAVNPFGKGIVVDKKPEAVQDVELTIDEKVEKAVIQYQQIDFSDNIKQISKIKMEIFAPSQIDKLLSKILTTTNSKILAMNYIYLYLSKLIQLSYNAGNNNFFLNMRDSLLLNLMPLRGKKDIFMHVTINGHVRNFFGMNNRYCIFDIQGDAADYCGNESNNCTYNIHGNTANYCGQKSKDSIYNINGDIAEFLGDNSNGCTYNINGKINERVSNCVEYSTFKVANKENYDLLAERLPKTNTVQLVNKSGRTIMETRK